MPRIIHTGQALVDATALIEQLPRRGQNSMAATWNQQAGGSVNILAAAARSGADAVHAGAIGTGPNGDLIRAALEAEGVSWSAPAVEDRDTALCVVLVEPSAERTFVTMLGAEREISVESLSASDPQPGDIVCVTGYSLAVDSTREPLEAWLAMLPDGVEVVLDPGAAFATLPAGTRARMIAATTVWTSNQEEADDYLATLGLGRADHPGSDMADAASALGGLMTDVVVIVRDGPHGCAISLDGKTTDVAGFPQEPVDTNGAGDAHTGVLVAERAKGTEWVEACRRANVAGAITVTRHGPATAPTAAEIDAFLAARA
ncbi:MAG TPA: PfkB family carbohydrate kinase [Tessaracoccus flavescens]|uniref:PfkB family carbohydrate kinase n=1 Tax=Tessaracoccus flavescens TaxID=399497 RepID=A0A921ELH8_9ACTN|nr:PfkB family carbohydrate kinase [Tessaracoccus flavescens]